MAPRSWWSRIAFSLVDAGRGGSDKARDAVRSDVRSTKPTDRGGPVGDSERINDIP